jgi:hypothetical protein
MRFVPIKSIEQQSDLTLHRVRQGFVEERTAMLNRIRSATCCRCERPRYGDASPSCWRRCPPV